MPACLAAIPWLARHTLGRHERGGFGWLVPHHPSLFHIERFARFWVYPRPTLTRVMPDCLPVSQFRQGRPWMSNHGRPIFLGSVAYGAYRQGKSKRRPLDESRTRPSRRFAFHKGPGGADAASCSLARMPVGPRVAMGLCGMGSRVWCARVLEIPRGDSLSARRPCCARGLCASCACRHMGKGIVSTGAPARVLAPCGAFLEAT